MREAALPGSQPVDGKPRLLEATSGAVRRDKSSSGFFVAIHLAAVGGEGLIGVRGRGFVMLVRQSRTRVDTAPG